MSRISCRVIRTLDELQTLSDVWNPLLERSPSNNLFLSWEWISRWCQVYLKENEPFVLVVQHDDRVVAIAPLWRQRERVAGLVGVRHLWFLGTGDVCSDYLDVIAESEKHSEWLRVIWDELFGPLRSEWDVWEYSDVPSDSAALTRFYRWADEDDRCMSRAISEMTVCPYLLLPETELLESLSKKRRYAINHSRELLETQGELTFRHCLALDDVAPELRRLADLNTRVWTERGHRGSFATDDFCQFHARIAAEMLEKNRLLLCSMWLEKKHMGTFYGFIHNRALYYYIMSVEVFQDRRVNVGDVLLASCMDEGIRRGCHEIDFLRGDEYYKYLWTRTERRNITSRFSNRNSRATVYELAKTSREGMKSVAKGLLKLSRRSQNITAPKADTETSQP